MTDINAMAREFRAARLILGWSEADMARALKLAGPLEKTVARVRAMEAGKRDVSGPVQVAVAAFLSGWRPDETFRPAA